MLIKRENDLFFKSPMNEKNKSPTQKIVSKKRNVECTPANMWSLKRTLVQKSESEIDHEDDILDIMTTPRRKIGGKIVHINVYDAPLDNVLFHSVENVQKWKFLCQRRVDAEIESLG